MVTRLGRRAIEGALVLFAALGFCFVPLGKKTGLDHARAMLSTGAAKEAGAGVAEAFTRLRQRIVNPKRSGKAAGAPPPSAQPEPALFRVTEADGPDASAPYSPGS